MLGESNLINIASVAYYVKEEMMVHLIIVTDCGGSDRARYEIAANRSFYPTPVSISFFETEPLSPVHAGFTGSAHALSTIDRFGPLSRDERIGLLINSAPRHGTEDGQKLRGVGRKPEGEEIYALKLKNGVWVVGPNAGEVFYFIQNEVQESYLVTDTSGMATPFRSMEIMVPTLAKLVVERDFSNIVLTPKILVVSKPRRGIFVGDHDSFGNIYLFSTFPRKKWIPLVGEHITVRIGNRIARLRHVEGIFAGETGEQTLTKGSLKLLGAPVYYIVTVGGSAYQQLGSPPVGTQVILEK